MNVICFTGFSTRYTLATDRYCVGGAIVLSYYNKFTQKLARQLSQLQDWHASQHDSAYHFPVAQVLADYLRLYNTSLNQDAAMVYSRNILEANDEGNFERAWIIAQWALAHEDGDPVPSSAELGGEVTDESALLIAEHIKETMREEDKKVLTEIKRAIDTNGTETGQETKTGC